MNSPDPAKTRVLLVDDSDDLSTVLAILINDEADLTCVGRLPRADELFEQVERLKPDVILMDLTMPGLDALEAMSRTAPEFPQCRFLVLSGYDDESDVARVLDAGAWGFVSKHSDAERILKAIRTVAGGDPYLAAN